MSINYFSELGAVPAIGRLINEQDSESPGASPIVVLSHRFWEKHFNGDSRVVGRKLVINGQPFTIVGVARKGFHGTSIRGGDLWVPLGMIGVSQGTDLLKNRDAAWLLVGGRLKSGSTAVQAETDLERVSHSLSADFPKSYQNIKLRLSPLSPVPGSSSSVTVVMILLQGLAAIILMVACVNLSSVQLSRAVARRREIAVRYALGANRRRLVRQLLTESVTLFLCGGVGGLFLARVLLSLVVLLFPLLPFPIEVSPSIGVDVLLYTSGLVLSASVLSGLAPAWHASKTEVAAVIKDGTQGPTGLRWRQVFVVGQLALSVLLVTIAGLFSRALHHIGASSPGFNPRGVELVSFDFSVAGYTDTTGPLFGRELVERVRNLPGVENASIAAVLPGGFEGIGLGGISAPDSTTLDGQSVSADWNIVEPGYFSTLQLPLIAGRDFNSEDRRGSQPVAIIGEGTANRLWPGKNPIGKLIIQERGGMKTALQVVGMARDPKFGSLVDGTTGTYVYRPLQQEYVAGWTRVLARLSAGHHLGVELREIVSRLNSQLPVPNVQKAEDYVGLGLLPQRVVAIISATLGIVGLLLAVVGVYGVTAYAVAGRTREIGIRIAIGATRLNIVGMVSRQGIMLIALGCTVGFGLAYGLGQLVRSFMFGTSPLDPATYLSTAALFTVIGLLACLIAARRAARVDPLEALRNE